MELPIVSKFDSVYWCSLNNLHAERIRILDIDGTYVVSIIVTHRLTKELIKVEEMAFSALYEAEEYIKDLGIVFEDDPEQEYDTSDWRDYDDV